MKKFISLLFWLGLCLTIFILCDSCNTIARKQRIGDRIILRGTDTVTVMAVTKTHYKVRYTRKNGTFYEYFTPKKTSWKQ